MSASLAQGADLTRQAFGHKLDRAIALNTTAPWRESQAILDELRPHLDLASKKQYAEYAYLEARNLILSGKPEAALSAVDDLLERELTARQKVRSYRLGANIAILGRRFEAAFGYLRDGLALLDSQEQAVLNEGLYGLASYSYAQVGELPRAREFGHLALEQARRTGQPRDLCYAEQQLAFVNKLDHKLDQARRYYRAAVAHCLEAGDELSASISESGLADLLRAAGEYGAAESLFEKALAALERAEFKSGVSEASLYYARLEMERGRHERVTALLRPVMDNLADEQTWDYLAEAHWMLGNIARNRGDLPRAMEHFEARMDAREKHLDMERARRVAFLEVDFDLRHTQQQLQLLREQARVRELEAESRQQRQRLNVFAYGLTALLMIILLMLLIRTTRERRRFQNLSNRDGLTSLSNHTRFFELAGRAFDLSVEKNLPFTLLLADIDHFKQINDRHGHLAGDEVLRRVGARLRESFSKHGIIGRIGGEEFGIALPGKRPDDITAPLEQLRAALAEHRDSDPLLTVTMSFGIAQRSDRRETLTGIRERADAALYRAKHAGRDRIVFADDPD
ncbi:MAG: diguanylate cyclase [Wenzhouxiangellaceae bacterium]|nr:diguanylate cyclase [Wenzhouxiangellaceae bacterium]